MYRRGLEVKCSIPMHILSSWTLAGKLQAGSKVYWQRDDTPIRIEGGPTTSQRILAIIDVYSNTIKPYIMRLQTIR